MKYALITALLGIATVCGTSGAQEFRGYPCTQDCSGHQAGYEWAERHDVTDPDECRGNSESFIEGCRAYAEEQDGDDHDEDCDEADSDDCDQ